VLTRASHTCGGDVGRQTSTASRTSRVSKRAGSSTSAVKTRPPTSEATSSRLDAVERDLSPPPKPATVKRKRESETPATVSSGAVQADERSESSRPRKKQRTVMEILLPPISSDDDQDVLLVPKARAKVVLQKKVPPKSSGASLDGSDGEESSPPKAKSKPERRSDVRSKDTGVRARVSGVREESRLPHSKTSIAVVPQHEERVTNADAVSAGSQDEQPRPPKKKLTSKRKPPPEQDDGLPEKEVKSTAAPIKIGPPRGVKHRERSGESGPLSKPGPSRTKLREDDPPNERVPEQEFTEHLDHEDISFGSPLLQQQDTVGDPTSPPPHISIPRVPLGTPPRSPDLSPGARARLELFDRMMANLSQPDAAASHPDASEHPDRIVATLSQDNAAPLPPDAPEGVPDDTHFNFDDTHDTFDTFDTFDLPRPPSSKPKPKQSKLGTPNGLIVPETESSGNSQSQSQSLLKPPSPQPARDQSPRKAIDLPTIAVIAASAPSSSVSPQDLFPPKKLPPSTNRLSKGPIFKMPSSTSRPTTSAHSRVADYEAPPSSIESFTSPKRVDKGKQRVVEDDRLQSSLSEGEGSSERQKRRMQKKTTDSGLKKRGKELFDQAQLAREAERQKNKKATRLKTVNDIVNGKITTPSNGSPLPFTSVAESSLEVPLEDVVDLSGGANSTTLDTLEHSEKPLSAEERERLRIELRQEVEESTQEAMGIYPPLPAKESEAISGKDAQMSPPRPPKVIHVQ